ncbi:MAG: hypothetical protein OXH39_24430 [Candidatus Poribacteria bacterium]|nr:hypothetical protein [Candidatus Poribacteria bacterium]
MRESEITDSTIVFDEPELEFRYGQRTADPRDGLALFGPYDADLPSRPGRLSYILIGTDKGITTFKKWADAMNRPAIFAPNGNQRLWPPFPGFEAAFCSPWSSKPVRSYQIDRDRLIEISRYSDKYERVFGVVDHYLEQLRKTRKLDESIGVAICVVPDEIWQNCRPESNVTDSIQRASNNTIERRRAGQLEFIANFDEEQYKLFPDFRRQFKARAMQYGIPLQILRESTLRLTDHNVFGERSLTPLSDRMWNIGTALYYKCGRKPWRLVTARDGVCYIGIAFRRAVTPEKGETACCAAQMFLDTGDGIVFLGEYGPWYSLEAKQFHLSKSAAHNLLRGILETYKELEGKELKEIFLHSRSDISKSEFSGYQDACPKDTKLVGVRVRTDRLRTPRLFRSGNMPVLRGTFWKTNNKSGLLWGSGFKPRIATYDGWETPIPLRIDIQHGEAPIERVAQDIFGLTKLNYNACHLGESQPVTVGFSDAVGEILISNPTVSDRKPNFKYYI